MFKFIIALTVVLVTSGFSSVHRTDIGVRVDHCTAVIADAEYDLVTALTTALNESEAPVSLVGIYQSVNYDYEFSVDLLNLELVAYGYPDEAPAPVLAEWDKYLDQHTPMLKSITSMKSVLEYYIADQQSGGNCLDPVDYDNVEYQDIIN